MGTAPSAGFHKPPLFVNKMPVVVQISGVGEPTQSHFLLLQDFFYKGIHSFIHSSVRTLKRSLLSTCYISEIEQGAQRYQCGPSGPFQKVKILLQLMS